MNKQFIPLIQKYLHDIRLANKELTKKELFKDLLHKLYSRDKDIEEVIHSMSVGAEKTVINIPRADRLHRGSADTMYNKIIIEFENNLKVSYEHAKEQLAGYMLGQFNSGEGYNFILIASDFINWKIVVPNVSQLSKLEHLKEHELILDEDTESSFTLTETNAEDFYYWIDRFLFKEQKQKATLKRIEGAFGYRSNTFIECYRQLGAVFQESKDSGELQTSYEQWNKFLSIAYGSFEDNDGAFVIHTYLSVLAKILAYEVLSNDDYIEDSELKGILDGSVFKRYNIKNFVDDDFFYWVHRDQHFNKLKKVFRLISQEIAHFDFNDVSEDVLKGVYQDLIDLDTRHALGEYYTPDWLCEKIIHQFNFEGTDKILDPSCGSGSFLRAAVHRIVELNPRMSMEDVNNCIFGIDVHPLSVQISKTTLLISLGKGVRNAKKPIHLNVILANTLLSPDGVQNLFGGEFSINIDKDEYYLNTQILEDMFLFDEALDVCEKLAEDTKDKKEFSEQIFETILAKTWKNGGLNDNLVGSFHKIYLGFRKAKNEGRDSIWKFILQNGYKPYFLQKKFDYVIGNPPWFTYSSIRNIEYQAILDKLGSKYEIKTKQKGTFAHLEIAAIFLAHCTNYFLKDTGQLAFVMPRSIFTGKQHENTRAGKVGGLKVTQIWDLQKVKPIFNVPCCVLFTQRAHVRRALPSTGLAGLDIAGKLSSQNASLVNTTTLLTDKEVTWYYSKLGTASAYTKTKIRGGDKVNPYKKLFEAGATLRPRTFCFIQLAQEAPLDYHDRIINIRTSNEIQEDAKKPWKGLAFNGQTESQFIFYTAISKSILPFLMVNPMQVILPIIINLSDDKVKTLSLKSADSLLQEGFLYAARWYQDCQKEWEAKRTEKNKVYDVSAYLNYQNKILTQDLNKPFLVLYNSSAKDANAVMVRREDFELEFIVDHKTYAFYTDNVKEAYYLVGILNSTIPNKIIKDFQTTGLYGARDVHKKILELYFPKFDGKAPAHIELSSLSLEAEKSAKKYFQDLNKKDNFSPRSLGNIRLKVKKHLQPQIKQIDKLVKEIITK